MKRAQTLTAALDVGNDDVPLEERQAMVRAVREGASAAENMAIDDWLVERVVHLGSLTKDLRRRIDQIELGPKIVGVVLECLKDHVKVRVKAGGEREIPIDREKIAGDLEVGDAVVLNSQLSVVVGRSSRDEGGEVGNFKQLVGDGRVLVSHGSEDLVCRPVNGIQLDRLRNGDRLIIDPVERFAVAKLEDAPAASAALPFEVQNAAEFNLSPADVGGLDQELAELLEAVTLAVKHGDLARRYRLDEGLTSFLLIGPPGCGKTLMAKVVAAEIGRQSKGLTRFVSLSPGEHRSEWMGASERSIRETWKAIRRLAGEGGHVLVFLDEVESHGRARGLSPSTALHDDLTNCLLSELDGLRELRNVILVANSNRPDLLDSALHARLSQTTIEVPRPRMAAAREILELHLKKDDPWKEGEGVRMEGVETALSLLYAPNANKILRIRFADSTSRTVKPRELVSGRLLSQIASNARRLAVKREIAGDVPGIGMEDVTSATERAIDGLVKQISRQNAHAHLQLPQDLAVVAVEALRPGR